MAMEIKNHPPAGGEENKKQVERLKNKINVFLLNYFNYLILALGLVILAVGLFVLVYPKYRQIYQANEEAKNNLQVEYEAKHDYLNSIRNLKKSYQLISDEEKAKIAGMVPATSDTSIIITEIESIVVRNSAVLTSIKIEPQNSSARTGLNAEPQENKEPPAGIFNELPQGVVPVKIEVNLSSVNYPILKNIIKTFENNLRLFDVARVDFNPNENKVLLNIYSYYLK